MNSDVTPTAAGVIHLRPSAPGAASWREAKPLYIGGKHVTAELFKGGLTIFKGTEIIYDGPTPAAVPVSGLNAWVADYALNYQMNYARPSEANAKLAQKVWETHYAIACSEDSAICNGDSPVYQGSQKLLLATLQTVYSLTEAQAWRVYDALIESDESVAHTVWYLADNG